MGFLLRERQPLSWRAYFQAKNPSRCIFKSIGWVRREVFEFRLEKAEDIARRNGKRFLDGEIVPLWVSEKDLHCFQ